MFFPLQTHQKMWLTSPSPTMKSLEIFFLPFLDVPSIFGDKPLQAGGTTPKPRAASGARSIEQTPLIDRSGMNFFISKPNIW
jgi:hypothetical protein